MLANMHFKWSKYALITQKYALKKRIVVRRIVGRRPKYAFAYASMQMHNYPNPTNNCVKQLSCSEPLYSINGIMQI